MSDRDHDPPSHDEPTPGERDGEAKRPSPAPGKTSRVERYYGMIQRRHLDGPRDLEPRLTAVSGSAMPDDLFDAFALHLDPVQREAEFAGLTALDPMVVHAQAARGLTGAPTALPHGDAIQRSFGPDHDVSSIRAHVGGPAAEASTAIGARAYATGDSVAFASAPDLHTAAHEAAHIVQQRVGVQLYGGVGQAGDPYEQHADAVADRVVRGESAADLLAAGPGGGGTVARTVQRKGEAAATDTARGMVALPPGVQRVNLALARLEDLKTEAQQLLRRWRTASAASKHASEDVRPHEQVAYQAQLDTYRDAAAEYLVVVARVKPPMTDLLAAKYDLSDAAAHGRLEQKSEVVLDALNEIARVGLVMTAHYNEKWGSTSLVYNEDRARMERLADAQRTLAHYGPPIGWTPPEDVQQAETARFSHEACPTGAADERPAQCNLPDSEREGLRALVREKIYSALREFKEACAVQRAAVEKLITADADSRKLVIDLFTTTIATAAGFATGGAAPVVAALIKAGTSVATKHLVKSQAKGYGASTTSMLDALVAAMREHLETIEDQINKLIDLDLRYLSNNLDGFDAAYFRPRIADLTGRYLSQVDPVGRQVPIEDRAGTAIPTGMMATYRAVRLRRGSLVRYALTAHDVDYGPGDATTERRIFVRWIDRDLAAFVADDAPEVTEDNVIDVPLLWPMEVDS